MKIIKCIVEDIREEAEGAEHYAKMATKFRDEDRALADCYAKMAETEIGHVNTLHEHAVRLIKAKKSTGAEVPSTMQAIWDWEHSKMVDCMARVKALLSMYRGQ